MYLSGQLWQFSTVNNLSVCINCFKFAVPGITTPECHAKCVPQHLPHCEMVARGCAVLDRCGTPAVDLVVEILQIPLAWRRYMPNQVHNSVPNSE